MLFPFQKGTDKPLFEIIRIGSQNHPVAFYMFHETQALSKSPPPIIHNGNSELETTEDFDF